MCVCVKVYLILDTHTHTKWVTDKPESPCMRAQETPKKSSEVAGQTGRLMDTYANPFFLFRTELLTNFDLVVKSRVKPTYVL